MYKAVFHLEKSVKRHVAVIIHNVIFKYLQDEI